MNKWNIVLLTVVMVSGCSKLSSEAVAPQRAPTSVEGTATSPPPAASQQSAALSKKGVVTIVAVNNGKHELSLYLSQGSLIEGKAEAPKDKEEPKYEHQVKSGQGVTFQVPTGKYNCLWASFTAEGKVESGTAGRMTDDEPLYASETWSFKEVPDPGLQRSLWERERTPLTAAP